MFINQVYKILYIHLQVLSYISSSSLAVFFYFGAKSPLWTRASHSRSF